MYRASRLSLDEIAYDLIDDTCSSSFPSTTGNCPGIENVSLPKFLQDKSFISKCR